MILNLFFYLFQGPYQFKRISLRDQLQLDRREVNLVGIQAIDPDLSDSEMASANVLTELSAQLSSKNKLSSSDGNVAKNSSTRSKPVPGPKPVFGDKPKADEIVASKQSPTDTSVTENGKKKKSGLFSRMKRLVKKPSKKHDNPRGSENGKYLSEKQRTKSTSDLDSRVLSNRDDRISIGSDAHSGLASGSETNDSEAKQTVSKPFFLVL